LTNRIARAGFRNALTRTLLHLTRPGVPAICQGDEMRNFTPVDPDNRRPAAYGLRMRALESLQTPCRASACRCTAPAAWVRRPPYSVRS
jgi:(1->4)-alpha-D-glucan 1-alpha-D-glucosylmutase